MGWMLDSPGFETWKWNLPHFQCSDIMEIYFLHFLPKKKKKIRYCPPNILQGKYLGLALGGRIKWPDGFNYKIFENLNFYLIFFFEILSCFIIKLKVRDLHVIFPKKKKM